MEKEDKRKQANMIIRFLFIYFPVVLFLGWIVRLFLRYSDIHTIVLKILLFPVFYFSAAVIVWFADIRKRVKKLLKD